MAVDRDPAIVFYDRHIEDIHDFHHMLESGWSHVFPTFIEKMDSLSVETFWMVAEANFRHDSISTVRMLNYC